MNRIEEIKSRRKVSYMDPRQVIEDGTIELYLTYRVRYIHPVYVLCDYADYGERINYT